MFASSPEEHWGAAFPPSARPLSKVVNRFWSTMFPAVPGAVDVSSVVFTRLMNHHRMCDLALAIRSGALDHAKLFEIRIGDPRNLFHMLVPGGQGTLLFTASPQKLLDAPVSLCAYK